jgi:hypothetical protein
MIAVPNVPAQTIPLLVEQFIVRNASALLPCLGHHDWRSRLLLQLRALLFSAMCSLLRSPHLYHLRTPNYNADKFCRCNHHHLFTSVCNSLNYKLTSPLGPAKNNARGTKYSEAATRGNLELELFLHGGFSPQTC